MFGPESIGKHITQLVANWVFPRESVFGPESIGKHITQLVANWVFPRESVFGPESIGKHITQVIANWVFPSETEYIAGGLLRKSTYPGTATPTQLQMYATDLRGEPRVELPEIYRSALDFSKPEGMKTSQPHDSDPSLTFNLGVVTGFTSPKSQKAM